VNVIAASANLRPLLQAARWEGWIVAVFHRGILCAAPDGRLLHLHTGSRLVSPFSLCIAGDFVSGLREAPLIQGMPVRKIGSGIDIADQVRFKLDTVTYYQSPSYIARDIAPEAVGIARQVLRGGGRLGGFEDLREAQTIVIATHQALADGNSAQMLEAARHLVGLGPGLTPSGDDFLVGCLRGLWLIRQNQHAAFPMLDRLRAGLLPDLDDRTTRVGAEFIRYALKGAFAEILDQAAIALLIPAHPQRVQSAVDRLLAQGETSGTDTTLGLLTCLEALLLRVSDREPRKRRQDTALTLPTAAATRG
jgi:Protein of unknown function (DUF2877)